MRSFSAPLPVRAAWRCGLALLGGLLLAATTSAAPQRDADDGFDAQAFAGSQRRTYEVQDFSARSRATLEIEDTGPGIAPENQSSVLDRFWRADRGDRRVMGLGLYIARSIAEAHGGGLTLESELGRGSTFRLSVPSRAPAPA